MAEITIRTIGGETLDEIVWRRYGATVGLNEAVLAANPGLADRGVILPADVDILLPELGVDQEQPGLKETIRLWD